MKIVHAIRSDGFAGVERHVSVLAAAQRAAGHTVTVIGGSSDQMRSALLPAGVQWRPATTTAQVARNLMRTSASLVHAHMTAAELAAVTVVRPGIPIVATRHFAGRRGQSAPGRALAPIIRARIATQLAVSRYVADQVDGFSHVVYPGVPVPFVEQVQDRQRSILAVQRLEPEKRVDLVLSAYALSGAAKAGWRLIVVGEGSARAELESFAKHLGLSGHVSFLGRREDVPELMARASLFVSACAVEGLGLSVLEAMAMGLPVVTTASGGHLETVGRVSTDYLFPAGDSVEAARRMKTLLGDPAERSAYGLALQQEQRNGFTPEQQERDTWAVYQEVTR